MGTVRNYAPVPHEYLEEMEALGDAEFGRLIRSLLTYSRDGVPIALNGNERFYAVRVMNCEDRFQKSFKEADEKASNAGKAAAQARWNKDTTACDRMPSDADACDRMRSDAIDAYQYQTNTKTNTKTKTKESEAHTRGEYGWVKLTDAQYEKLLKDLGQEELERCIRYVDESAQKNHNKNKWTDWNLVVRNCHRDGWGLDWQEHAQRKAKPKKYSTASEYKAPQPSMSAEEIYNLADRI